MYYVWSIDVPLLLQQGDIRDTFVIVQLFALDSCPTVLVINLEMGGDIAKTLNLSFDLNE